MFQNGGIMLSSIKQNKTIKQNETASQASGGRIAAARGGALTSPS